MTQPAREIENLLYTYAERIDAGDLAGVAALFAHGRVKAGPDADAEGTFEGSARVLEMYSAAVKLYEDGTPRTRHVMTNARIEVADDGQTATAHSVYTVLQAAPGLPLQPIISGHYGDRFHRTEGRWHFETRVMFVDLVGDLGHHLLYELPPR